MGRTKGSKNKKNRSRESESKNLTSLIILFIGIFLAVIIYTISGGTVSEGISDIFGGLCGKVKYVIPVAISAIGIYGIFKGKDSLRVKFFQTFILLIIVCSFFSWANYTYDNTLGFWDNINNFWGEGKELKNGGVLGSLVTIPLWQAFGKAPALVVLIALASIFAILVVDIPVELVFSLIKESVVDLFYTIVGLFSKEDDEEEEEEEEKPKRGRRYKEENEDQLEFDFNKLPEEDEEEEEEESEAEEEETEDDEEDEELVEMKKEAHEKLVQSGLFKTRTKEEVEAEEEEEDDTIEELQLEHNEVEEYEDYVFPTTKLLDSPGKKGKANVSEQKATADKLQQTLNSFGVKAKVVNVSQGPSVTRYEVQPNVGVKVSQIVNLTDDIALNLAAANIRIEAPIPGKAAVGIEIPNKARESVSIKEMLETKEFKNAKSKLAYPLGKDIAGNVVISDIVDMPHMLICGATGSGKSVCVNTIITSILFKAKPNEVKFVMIDPKMVELKPYNGIPHLLIPVVIDPKKAAGALNWAVQEMVLRYSLFDQNNVKNIEEYNMQMKEENESAVLPQIVIIIDELADLMMVAKNEVEDAICRLAQMARAAGMHLVIATQRPSVDVITGLIKANIPSRIAFSVSSQIDSRTILDMPGAERLVGKGDMLYYPTGLPKPVRLQGPYVSSEEINRIVDFIKENNSTTGYDEDIIDKIENGDNKTASTVEDDDIDALLTTAIDLVVEMGTASTSMLQRKLKIGYSRAGRIIDQMEARGIISGYDGSKPRQVLLSKEELQTLKMESSDIVENEVEEYEDDSEEEDED